MFKLHHSYLLLLLFLSSVLFAKEEIKGTIIAKKGELVQINFHAKTKTIPQVNDTVKFSSMISGIPINCGNGVVTEVSNNSVWIKPEKNNLKVKMEAIIQATGIQTSFTHTIKLPGVRKKDYWYPSVNFNFNYSKELDYKNDEYSSRYFLSYVARLYYDKKQPPIKLSYTTASRLEMLELFHNKRVSRHEARPLRDGEKISTMWTRKISGKNVIFFVTHLFEVKKSLSFLSKKEFKKEFPKDSYSDYQKTNSQFSNEDNYLISFFPPKPKNTSEGYITKVWYLAFSVDDFLGISYDINKWEKVLLNILKTAHVEPL